MYNIDNIANAITDTHIPSMDRRIFLLFSTLTFKSETISSNESDVAMESVVNQMVSTFSTRLGSKFVRFISPLHEHFDAGP